MTNTPRHMLLDLFWMLELGSLELSLSAAALACSALGANTARTRPDYLVASADRTHDVHEHVTEGFLHALGMAAPIRRHLRSTIVLRMVADDVNQLLLARPRKVGHRTIKRLLFHFWYLF